MRIGIIGGIASGKTTVVNRCKENGLCAIHADDIAHKVIQMPMIVDQIRARWNVTVSGMSYSRRIQHLGSIQVFEHYSKIPIRKNIAKIIFSIPSEKHFLESIMWPLIDAEIKEQLSQFKPRFIPAIMLDIPLLIEGFWKNLCDEIWFVESSFSDRVKRYHKRVNTEQDNFSLEDATADLHLRESFQVSLDEKRRLATKIIENNDLESTNLQVDALCRQILSNEVL